MSRRGRLSASLGRNGDALPALEHALALRPGDAQVLAELASRLGTSGHEERAQRSGR